MDSWSGAQKQNLSVVIYHTLFSHNEERFHQTGFKREKKKRRENLNSKTFFYKDCSLVQSKIGLTTIVLTKLLMSKYKTAGIMKREREEEEDKCVCVCISIYIYI